MRTIYDPKTYGNPTTLGISKELHEWLVNWTFYNDFLRYYQNNGISAIPKSLVDEMQQFIPKTGLFLYRFFVSLEEEKISMMNKLTSFSSNFDLTVEMTKGDKEAFIRSYFAEPSEILVDTSLIAKRSQLPSWDLADEVILIK